jgi:DNA invertase Pin-like site-specific DNA recombinase
LEARYTVSCSAASGAGQQRATGIPTTAGAAACIAKAKAAGKYKSRPVSIDAANVKRLKADGFAPTEIARRLGVARSSVYRLL